MGTGWYANPSPTFQPAMRFIIGITNANPAVVTTSLDSVNPGDHNYLNGMVVRLNIPNDFGMYQINKMKGAITIIDDTTFSIAIDTRYVNVFVIPSNPEVFANISPVGELNYTIRAATVNVLPTGEF